MWICSVSNGFWLWLVLLALVELLLLQLECTYVFGHLLKDGEQALGRFLLQVVQICADVADILIQDMAVFRAVASTAAVLLLLLSEQRVKGLVALVELGDVDLLCNLGLLYLI